MTALYRLPPARYRVRARSRLRVRMADGASLVTAHFAPLSPGNHPTLLMRVPYGMAGFSTVARLYAERGFHVVLQACRGTGGSEGEFDPLQNEREDGLATLDWIKRQHWFDGRIGLSGPSYLGYATWAISDALPPGAAMSTKVTSAEFRSVVFPGGALHLGLLLSWMQTVEALRGGAELFLPGAMLGQVERRTERAAMRLPLLDADQVATGHEVGFWRRWLGDDITGDAFWADMDHRHRIGPATPPNHFISGWYDFMLDQLLSDYQRLVAAGQRPYLTIGTWTHVSPQLQVESIRETLIWMQAHLCDDRTGLREKPVRLHISGLDEWREFEAYPPEPRRKLAMHLHPGSVLSAEVAPPSPPDRYRYDPAHPTPNVGGAQLAFTGAGPVRQNALEARADVLTYTSEPLVEPLTIIGNVEATLFVRASLPNFDVFAKLCDIAPSGTSINICDAILRRTAVMPPEADGVHRIEIRLHATAHQFRAGHRLRLQVSSGAHPRIARNTGTDEPIGSESTLLPVDVEILHDPDHPSALSVPMSIE